MIRLGIYSQIKEQIDTRDVAEHYGYKLNRQGMMRCPFHNDKSPSMKVDKNFICFGCQQKGDVIDFASKLFGLSQYDAAQKLIAEMGLSVNQEKRKRAKPGTVHRAKRERSEQELFELAVTRVYKVYCDYFRLMNQWSLEFAPGSPDEKFHPLFVEAMHKMSYVEYLLDLLLNGSVEEKAQIVIEKGKEVKKLEKRIREIEAGDAERTALSDSDDRAGKDGRRYPGDAGDNRQGCGKGDNHERRNRDVL